MKKLAIIINGLGYGGSEISMFRFLDYLDYSKYEVTIIVLKGPLDLSDMVDSRCKVKYLYKDDPYLDAPLFKGIKKALEDKKKNLILPIFGVKLLSLIKTKFFKHNLASLRKRIVTSREHYDIGLSFEFPTMNFLVDKLDADLKIVRHNYGTVKYVNPKDVKYINKCDRVITLTELLKEDLNKRYNVPLEKITVITQNYDNEEIVRKSQEKIIERKAKYVFASTQRVVPYKNIELIIEALNILNQHNIDFYCYIVGGPDLAVDGWNYFNAMKDLAEKYNLSEKIEFTGAQRNPLPYVNACDIFLHSSNVDAAPRSIREALILGKPCLAGDIIGTRALIHPGENGELCNSTPEDYAKTLMEMLENLDEIKAKQVPEYVDNDAIMNKYYRLFNVINS